MIERRNEFAPLANALIVGIAAAVGVWLWSRLANKSTPVRVFAAIGVGVALAAAAFAVKSAISN
jgi:predicted MFS family arabinose efflux permease